MATTVAPRIAAPASDSAFAIDVIPEADRHGRPRELFGVWFAANVIFNYVIIGEGGSLQARIAGHGRPDLPTPLTGC